MYHEAIRNNSSSEHTNTMDNTTENSSIASTDKCDGNYNLLFILVLMMVMLLLQRMVIIIMLMVIAMKIKYINYGWSR